MKPGILPGIGPFLVGLNISVPTAGATPGWCFPEMVGFPVLHHLHHLRLPGRNCGVASTPQQVQERGPQVLTLTRSELYSLPAPACFEHLSGGDLSEVPRHPAEPCFLCVLLLSTKDISKAGLLLPVSMGT